jgi:two-component system, sensor histidine kinase PdtaS
MVIPIGLIMNELLSNAFKHAFDSPCFDAKRDKVISIQLKRHEDQNLMIAIKDNGIGLPEGLDITSTNSLGLKLVTMLSKQIKGRLAVMSENGAQFSIIIPL